MSPTRLRYMAKFGPLIVLNGCVDCWVGSDQAGCHVGAKDTAGGSEYDCSDMCYAGDGAVPTGTDGTDYDFMGQSWACERLDGDTPISRAFSVASHYVFPDYVTADGSSISYSDIESDWETAVDGLLPSDGGGANVQIGTTFVTDRLDSEDPLTNAVYMHEGLAFADDPDGTLAVTACTEHDERACQSIDCDIKTLRFPTPSCRGCTGTPARDGTSSWRAATTNRPWRGCTASSRGVPPVAAIGPAACSCT